MPAEDRPSTAAPEPASTPLPEPVDSEGAVEVELTDDHGPPPDRAPRRRRTGALPAVGVVAILVLGGFLLAGRADRNEATGPAWSAWEPSKDGAAGAKQIAAHVGPQYRGPDGRELVHVEGGALELSGLPLTVAVRDAQSGGGEIRPFNDAGVLYRLCGTGKDCAIATGKPSIQRHLLLRREALELALYSLRYLDGVKEVVVFMPPKLGDQPRQLLFFRASEVGGELRKPLDSTLVDRKPSVARAGRSPDALLVEQLTIPALFRFSLTPAGKDGRAFLVLEPFDAAAPTVPALQDPSRSNASFGALTSRGTGAAVARGA